MRRILHHKAEYPTTTLKHLTRVDMDRVAVAMGCHKGALELYDSKNRTKYIYLPCDHPYWSYPWNTSSNVYLNL